MLEINSYVDNGRFLILDVLGKGGSGVAYLALDTQSSRSHPKYYCIKAVARPHTSNDANALMREIRLHKLVSGFPGVVTLKRCVQHGPLQLFIMDYLPGGDLFRQITQQHRYFHNDDLIRSIFVQVIDAVQHCHNQGVFHRDLKPENVLCNSDGTRVVLADFGLATRQSVSDDLGVGSGYYMSPECNLGPSYGTVENDLWSLGVILCNLAFGRNPWAQAIPSDPTFAAYASNPNYLSAILPVPPAVAHILTGPRGLFSLDPRRRMGLHELREQILRVRRFVMTDDELSRKGTSAEAKSVATVLRNAVLERDAKLRREAAATASSSATSAASTTTGTRTIHQDGADDHYSLYSYTSSVVETPRQAHAPSSVNDYPSTHAHQYEYPRHQPVHHHAAAHEHSPVVHATAGDSSAAGPAIVSPTRSRFAQSTAAPPSATPNVNTTPSGAAPSSRSSLRLVLSKLPGFSSHHQHQHHQHQHQTSTPSAADSSLHPYAQTRGATGSRPHIQTRMSFSSATSAAPTYLSNSGSTKTSSSGSSYSPMPLTPPASAGGFDGFGNGSGPLLPPPVIVDAVVGPGGLAWPVPPATPPTLVKELSNHSPMVSVAAKRVPVPTAHPFSSTAYDAKGRAVGWNGPQPQLLYAGGRR